MYQSRKAAANQTDDSAGMEDYMMASKSVGVIPLALSLVTSFMSAITVLGVPAEILKCGKGLIISIYYSIKRTLKQSSKEQCTVGSWLHLLVFAR